MQRLRKLLTLQYLMVAGLIAIWVMVLAALPALLPLQLASWLAFVALLITPGYLLGDMITWKLDLDVVERLALAFVRDLARRGFQTRSEELYARLTERLPQAQCETIESTAHVMNLANRFGNTFDAARARLSTRRDCTGASVIDVTVVSGIFIPAALLIAPWIGALMIAQQLGRRAERRL